nr:S-layer homology domain-containing protein [Eubacterium sp.]
GETKEEVIPMIGSTDPVKEALSVESITGNPVEMKVGDKQALTVIFNRDLTVDDSFEWIVSDPSVVSVEDGMLKANGAGAADVSFKLNGTESKNSFTVKVYGKYVTPAVPQADKVDDKSISVTPVEGCVYSIDGVTWQAESVFTGLNKDTVYTVFAKKAATEYMKESAPSKAALIKTEDKWPFNDYASTETLAGEVLYAYKHGVASGFGKEDANGQVAFKATKNVTRAQFAIMVYGMAGKPSLEGIDLTKYNYPDVPKTNNAYTAVVWASAHGIIKGYPNGKFKPDNSISRAQIAVMLKAFADYKEFGDKYTTGGQSLTTFADYGEVQEQVKESLQWAIDNGVLSGITATKLKPNGTARRDQCAAFCARFYKKFME